MVIREYNLETQFDSRKSFYGKAVVQITDLGAKILRSYNTAVAMIDKDGKPHVYGTYSPTTLRHVKEFLKQHGFKADTKSQIINEYC